jgi:hypothetical protein
MAPAWFLQRFIADTKPLLCMQLTGLIIEGLTNDVGILSLDA